MKTIRDTKWWNCQWDEGRKLMIVKFKLETEHKTSEQMKEDVLARVKMIEQYKPIYFISDQKHNRYVYKIGEQKWVQEETMNKFIKIGLKKMAFIYPEELISELALRQVVDETGGRSYNYEVEYFSTEAEAMEWFGI